MRFYDALQLDPAGLKHKIRTADTPKEKHRLMAAIVLRAVLIVLFSILTISPVSLVFGAENSPMAVSLLCILLGIRFVDFNYCIRDSLVNLGVVFSLLLLAPCAAAQLHPLLAGLIHCASFFVILFMTCDQPRMGNAGLYTFAYIYLSGSPVSGVLFWKRAALTLVGFLICGAILYAKHRTKHRDVRFADKLRRFRFSDGNTLWLLRLAVGVGVILALGSLFSLERMMWAAFACGSVLGCYTPSEEAVRERFSQRLVGTLLGTVLFWVSFRLIPVGLHPIFGLLGGVCLGFCTDYRYKTASNCLGALFAATGLYGLPRALFLRVTNNLLGLAFGGLVLVVFQWLIRRHPASGTSNSDI